VRASYTSTGFAWIAHYCSASQRFWILPADRKDTCVFASYSIEHDKVLDGRNRQHGDSVVPWHDDANHSKFQVKLTG
jgi:hypothetical protein